MSNAVETLKAYFDVLSSKQGEGLADLVTDDVKFAGPFFQADGSEAFLRGMQQWIGLKKTYTMQRQLINGDETCSLYQVIVTSPKGVTVTISMSDWIELRAGKIAREQVFFDPTEWAKAIGK